MPQVQRKTIFITGASGYIGSKITELVIADGFIVRGLSRSEKNDDKLRAIGAEPVRGSIDSFDVLTVESANADIVIHLVDTWIAHFNEDYSAVVRDNNLAIDAIVKGIQGTMKPLIVASGSAIVKPDPEHNETDETSPLNIDGINRRYESEQYALDQESKGVRVYSIRLAPYVYGHGGSGIALFMQLALQRGTSVYVGDGLRRTSTVHVNDAAHLFLLVGDLAKAMAEALGIPVKSVTEEEAIAQLGPALGKFISLENIASSAKAVRELGWKTKEVGVLEDIAAGSYVAVAESLKSSSS
ncbi:NAD dependent epimerase/dehydratase family domain-containing protein [Trichoderma breve]|uniref:NAD dependent epimerase/dehydratase family domain-containing protein n=1 Tax=Trichoderma breve TaxID=2034170 RepID=A0A9W9JTE5_9HYPO|nr:NAD dependent epimerase/dehydratase family domain-containing protein [Trichoderma breve]KAJ4865697.1 NAD dependent epimerase/dehydratase family domain-containing protein [Trichoderma breve]